MTNAQKYLKGANQTQDITYQIVSFLIDKRLLNEKVLPIDAARSLEFDFFEEGYDA